MNVQERFNHEAHKRLWDILANNPGMDKETALSIMGFEPYVVANSCFACEARTEYITSKFGHQICNCPLEWGVMVDAGFSNQCLMPTGAYKQWCYTTWHITERDDADAASAIQYARQVRDMPLNPDFFKE